MSTESQTSPLAEMGRDEMMSALFANMVFQSTNAALMFLGQVPHPETNEAVLDLEAARMFIDQLDMLAVKTKGNLSHEEEKLLQQSLTHLRLAFVEAVEKSSGTKETTPPAPAMDAPGSTDTPSDADEPRKRFTKKY